MSVVSCKLSDKGETIKMTKSLAFPQTPPFVMLVPLQEILAQAIGGLPASVAVQAEYKKLTDFFGGEFNVLLKTSISDIQKLSGSKTAEAISKVRSGDIVVDPGYDGVFGVVKIWKEEEKKQHGEVKDQLSLF